MKEENLSKKLRICATCKLSKKKIFDIYKPLCDLSEVESILLIRDEKGYEIEKLEYIVPRRIRLDNRFVKSVMRLVMMFYICLKEKPDVINATYLIPHGINAFIVGKIFRKPVVLCLIGSDINIGLSKWYGGVLPYLLKRVDCVTVRGTFSRNEIIRRGIDSSKVHILPVVIDTRRFKPREMEKEYDLVFAGFLVQVKRVDIILQAVSRVANQGKRISLAIVGDGPLRDRLERMAIDLGIADHVDFLGYREDMENCFNRSKVAIMASSSEGLPAAMLEAMACGLPCILPAINDIPDVAANNFNSLLIDRFEDVEGYAKAILRLIDDETLYAEMSKNALRIRAKCDFRSATKVWKRILQSPE